MIKYLLLTNNTFQIHHDNNLISKCNSWSGVNLLVYKTFSFAQSTCFMRTVREELKFVIDCQISRSENVLNLSDFIDAWKYGKYLDTNVASLSGGWRKYLGLSLFSNRKSIGKLYLDGLRHLSDNLINNIFNNLDLGGDDIVIFAEYESEIIKRHDLEFLYDLGDKLSLQKWQSQFLSLDKETNYA